MILSVYFQQVAENRPIKISLSIDDNVPQYILGDSIRIKQILDNLLNNALKFYRAWARSV